MNFWNRLLVTLLAMLTIVGAMLIVLLAAGAIGPDFLPGSGEDSWFYPQLNHVSSYDNAAKAATFGISAGVILAMLLLIYAETRIISPRDVLIPVSRSPGISADGQTQGQAAGMVNVDASSVRLLAERVGIANRDVESLRCSLVVRSKPVGGPASIEIRCYPNLRLGSHLPEVSADIRTRIHEAVERLTGLRVTEVNVVRVRYTSDDDSSVVIS